MRVAQTLPSSRAGASSMIRTRWLIAIAVVVVAGIGALVYQDELKRSDAALQDLGERQAELASIAAATVALAPAQAHVALAKRAHRSSRILIAPPGGELTTLEGEVVHLPSLSRAIANDTTSLRLSPEDASSLGFPPRTAMVGFARTFDGGMVAVATSAEHQRDRDRTGRNRVLLSMALAAAVMTAFTFAIWKKQHHEAELARNLAVAEAARARDAELDRLHRAATMAALGSGVAHELSTPLGVIVGRAEQLLSRAAGDERSIKNVQVILEQTEHINQVVRGLLGLARGAPIALQSIEARELVSDAAALVQHRFVRKNVALEPNVAGVLPEIRCEPLLFKHALVNLLLNACDASPAKSTVRVDVTADAAEMAFVVTDEGEGISAEHAKRATEPFFTTKPPGEGTGLGLAIANEIAKTHRGSLDLAQRSPHGTRACIRIPLETSPA